MLTKAAVAGGFVCLVLVAAGGSAAVSPKTALVAHACRGPSQVRALAIISRLVCALKAGGSAAVLLWCHMLAEKSQAGRRLFCRKG
jgi:hypothetical protein